MPHHTPLIGMIVAGIVLAFVLGAVANRLRVSPLVGYLLAGVAVGPYTPGFVADQGLANQLAEIGVILLMFGVGMHFSLKDLLSVKAIAIPGAIVQIAIATLLGMGLAATLGWAPGAGFVFGLALSVASTVVLLRAMQERHLVETERGRIAVGWLIVEDLAMVLALVLLPALGDMLRGGDGAAAPNAQQIMMTLVITLGKVAAFVVLMLVVGRRAIPWILHYVAHTGSRELFRLAVLAIALGVAFGAAELFDVSFALGAFFAGMVLAESELSHQAANETLPLRDAFAVLFFVSVGMLFDPAILLREPLPVLAVLFIILFGKSIAAFVIMRVFRYATATALTISASLAQIGEFSFILANLGVELEVLPERGRDLILVGAILSILANPLFFAAIDRMRPLFDRAEPSADAAAEARASELPMTSLTGHTVLIGYGRVGGAIGEALLAQGAKLFVIEENETTVASLRARGIEAHAGNAASPALLRAANLPAASRLFLAVPNAFEGGQVVEQARQANAALKIVARAHLDSEVDYLRDLGADAVVMGEREIARAMLESA
jgi:monovalent cation:H+ antiporter-2, CPA2 family